MRKIVMFGFAAAMIASPAFADPAATSAQPQPTAVADSDKVICHYMYHEGAIIRRPVCMTASRWEYLRMQQQHDLAYMEAKASLHH